MQGKIKRPYWSTSCCTSAAARTLLDDLENSAAIEPALLRS